MTGSAYDLTPSEDVRAIKAEDREFYGHDEWPDFARDLPTRPPDAELLPQRVIHMRAQGGRMPCCGKSPFDMSPWDRMTRYPALVTCSGYGERYCRELDEKSRREWQR